MDLIFVQIFKYYKRKWPSDDPGLYSYIIISFLLTINIYSIFLFVQLFFNLSENGGKLVPGFIFFVCLILCYGRYYRNTSGLLLKRYKFHGKKACLLTNAYLVISVFLILIAAHLLRIKVLGVG